MGLLCYPFSLDRETFSGAKVNKKVFYAKKIWEYLLFFDTRYEKNRNMPAVYELLYNLSSTYKCNFLGADNKQ